MKRCLMILALCISLFNACVIDSSETSNYNYLSEAVANEVDDRLVFPIVMAETALLIDVYEKMTPEEKIQMGYIYRNVLKTEEGKYTMNGFYDFALDTGGKSLDEPGAEWVISTNASSFEYRIGKGHFLLSKSESGDGYILVCEHEGAEPYDISLRVVEDEEAYYSWEIEMECNYMTARDRDVTMVTDAPIVRKVYRKISDLSGCNEMMHGSITVDIKDHDVVRHYFDGEVRLNNRYDF